MGKTWPATEVELAAAVRAFMLELGMEVYQEVQVFSYSPVADLVGVLPNGIITVVETKRSLSLSVMDQAWEWMRQAHYTLVAVPDHGGAGNKRSRRMSRRILCHLGIGCWFVSTAENHPVNEDVAPRLHRQARVAHLRQALTSQHKTFAAAGNASGRRWSPFQNTAWQICEFVARRPDCTMKELIDGIRHHYCSSAVARSALAKWIQLGKVKGVRARVVDRKLRVCLKAKDD